MSELKTVAPYKSVVDAQWYLATYPDVAIAGADPQQHYDLHGAAEGRLPRYLQAWRLESALWGGFAKSALPELKSLQATTDDPDEMAYASWALARWYASAAQWPEALQYIHVLTEPLPAYIGATGAALLRAEVLLRNNEQTLAQACIAEAIATKGTTDFYLAAANVSLPTEDARHQTPEARRLYWLNRALAAGDLAPVTKHAPKADLTLDNLHATCAAQVSPKRQAKISVVMPAYNAQDFIETALRSLLAQSWSNLEIIVVDDCSTDATVERVSAMASEDARIVLLKHPMNRGAYAARNTALKHATGTFVVNHDSDDWSHPQRLELMAAPLLQDSGLVATVAEWVRTDTNLHFQSWRIENSLIEPSVSTMMMRSEAVRQMGGWDEVRVAADHELRQRLQRRHGNHAVLYLLPGVPLVIARQLPQSLTMASATHLRSTFFGLRQLYSALADTWHQMTDDASELCIPADPDTRAFPAPALMLRTAPAQAQYDWLLIGDLSDAARCTKAQSLLLGRLQEQGMRVALLHWPEYQRPAPISGAWLRQAVTGSVDIVLAEQQLAAERVVIVGRHLLAHPLDHVPVLQGLQNCQMVDSVRDVKTLAVMQTNAEAPSKTEERSGNEPYNVSSKEAVEGEQVSFEFKPDSSLEMTDDGTEWFDAAWYLQRYPDVENAGIAPREHYLAHGFAEGREPGPHFNTSWYFEQCPEARDSGLPALMHYENVGCKAGYNPGHPSLPGEQEPHAERPTVLLCAHSANTQLFGAERCLLDVMDACNALQLNVLVSVPTMANMAYIEELRARALRVVCVPTQAWSANAAPCSFAIERFRALIRDNSVALVHANTLMLREPLIAARRENVPAVLHAHESPAHDPALCAGIGLPADQIVHEALERADYVLANSAFTAEHLAKPNATHVVSNIVDFKAFDIPNIIDNKCITAALISSNLPKKGVQDLLQLACDTAKDTPNLQLLLVGPDTPNVSALRTLEARGQLPANLKLLPYAATAQAAVAQANIILNLSHCQETFGRTLLEGMAASRPVLAYRWGALPELIDEGVNGHTFEHGDTKAIANKLRQLSRNPKKIRTLGAAGRKRAKQYNLKRLCKQLGQAYGAILDYPLQTPTRAHQSHIEELT
ncbi:MULTISPECIES: glycosyltransferase [unclassified Pseudomonas]|uniref:glycosyltransferase n=1 Tax=unclassified Pseudomonas TaxID=196821 RepID=UPI000B5100AA|nr:MULTISPECIES: glycosyltransferase [unclassified Pseudomonas]TFA89696.1 glycosyl transferase family 4 [Pseudomonas sp. URIL14HWK12:I1]SNB69452.1 Glycosyltransferases involved in cell wall biogenesis [Pseudomonas sp. LAIL14HWK12:I4]